jgi:hypothetical protein
MRLRDWFANGSEWVREPDFDWHLHGPYGC